MVTRGQERDGRWHWQLARWLMVEGCPDAAEAEFGRALAAAPADADAIRADAVENCERRDGVLPRTATTLAAGGATSLPPGRATELRPNPAANGR